MDEIVEKKPRRLWKIVFAISLAMNLAIVGIIAGISLRTAGGKPPQAFDFGLGTIAQAMTREQRRDMVRALRASPDVELRGRPHNRRAVDQIIAVLREDEFDPEALRNALQTAGRRISTLQNVARNQFVSQVQLMSQQERIELSERLEAVSAKRRGP